jgi:hypothetical protein
LSFKTIIKSDKNCEEKVNELNSQFNYVANSLDKPQYHVSSLENLRVVGDRVPEEGNLEKSKEKSDIEEFKFGPESAVADEKNPSAGNSEAGERKFSENPESANAESRKGSSGVKAETLTKESFETSLSDNSNELVDENSETQILINDEEVVEVKVKAGSVKKGGKET